MKLREYYDKFIAILKWVMSKIFLILGGLTAIDIAANYTSMTEIYIMLAGIFMVMCVVISFVLDTNIIVNRLQRR